MCFWRGSGHAFFILGGKNMKKVEITQQEFEEYIRLREFFRKTSSRFNSFNINFLNIKLIAFQALAPENITQDMFRLMAETVSRASSDFSIIKDAYDDMPGLIDTQRNI